MAKRSNQQNEAETPGVIKAASFAMVPAWLARDPAVTDRAIRLYAVLGSIGPVAFAGWAHLANLCGDCSVSTIGRAMKALADVGAIRVTPQYRADGMRRTNEYELARDEPFPLVAPLAQICASRPVRNDRPARSNMTEQELEKCDVEKCDVDTPSLDPADQAAPDLSRELATGYWEWFKSHHGTKPAQEFMAIAGIFRKLLASGWSERDVKLAAVEAGSPFTLRSMHSARVRLKCGQRGGQAYRPTDPTKAALDSGRFGLPDSVVLPPGETYRLSDDEVRELAGLPPLGVSDGKP